jgi:hypothetical protein
MTDLFVVKESFVVDVAGTPIAYRKGEVVDPDDPITKTHAASLELFEFPHPVPRKKSSGKVEQATAAPGEKRAR